MSLAPERCKAPPSAQWRFLLSAWSSRIPARRANCQPHGAIRINGDMRHTIGIRGVQTIRTQNQARHSIPIGHAGERLRFLRLFPPCRVTMGNRASEA